MMEGAFALWYPPPPVRGSWQDSSGVTGVRDRMVSTYGTGLELPTQAPKTLSDSKS